MFTSRAEFRILLRQDNADQRLTPLAHELGLAKPERWQRLQEKMEQLGKVKNEWERLSVVPNEVNKVLEKSGSKKIDQKVKAISLLSRPQLGIHRLLENNDIRNRTESITRDQEVLQQLEIETKYSGYIQRERENAEKLKRLEYVQIPTDFEYQKLGSMSMEARQKLAERRPENIGQASRISGVSPSDIQVLLVYLGR
jgi:tRNA uridine 5-carboxymethylaminomethyl modification enzyme